MLNTRKRSLDAAQNFMDEYRRQDVTPTVFMDASNPLLSQAAIFARLLEMSEKEEIPTEPKPEQSDGQLEPMAEDADSMIVPPTSDSL